VEPQKVNVEPQKVKVEPQKVKVEPQKVNIQYGSVKIPPPTATPLKRGYKEDFEQAFLRGVGGIFEE
ncbi:MAG: hypothetical protein RMX97_29590, partial [Nostoc sp. DedQUE11]|nr:hypothetical protein [Nostoc sp. DedQUE11]